jgi:acyl-CoA thioesterase FadM
VSAPAPHVKRLAIRARDLSEAAHVHNGVYLAYLEEVSRELLDPILTDGYTLGRVEIDYRAELVRADREVLASLAVERVGTSSVVVAIELRKPGGELAAQARCVFVAVDDAGSRPLTDAERSGLAALGAGA